MSRSSQAFWLGRLLFHAEAQRNKESAAALRPHHFPRFRGQILESKKAEIVFERI